MILCHSNSVHYSFLNVSLWILPLITGQHATRSIWSYIIWQLEGGVCSHMRSWAGGRGGATYGGTDTEDMGT